MAVRRKPEGWEARVYVGMEGGKKRFATKYFADRAHGGREKAEKAARLWEAETRRQVEAAAYVPPTRQTVAEFLDEWLEKDAKPNVKARTYERYQEIVNVHLKPALGATRLDRLTPAAIAGLLVEKREAGLSGRTCLHIYRVLHRALNVAVTWGLVGRNVCDAVRPPKADEEAPVGLSADQVEALLEAARTVEETRPDGTVERRPHRLYPLFLTAVHTGMRQGELLALRWEDVDLDAGVALVRRALEKPGKQPVFTTPKNHKPRVVPLAPEVVEALKQLRVEQEIERAFFGKDYEDYALVFAQPNGRPLDGHSLTRWHLKRLVKKVNDRAKALEEKAKAEGVALAQRPVRLPENLRFHDLRHTFVSRALQAGANPRAVSEIAGHHDPGFTLRRYAHALPQDTKEAVQRLAGYLRRTADPQGQDA